MASLRARLTAIPTNRLILFLDFDGTLSPIASHPSQARLSRSVRDSLWTLADLLPIVFISGRPPKDLRQRVGLRNVYYVGHHGLSCIEADGAVKWLTTPPHRMLVRRWVQALRNASEGIEGAVIEDKGMTVALHDRLVEPRYRVRLRRRALRSLAPWIERGSVSLLRGKRVLEARSSRAGNKGTAVSMLLRRPWARHRVPVYFGDDQTDFDAFSVIRGRDWRFGSAGGVVRPAKMPGSLTPGTSIRFWSGWPQGGGVGKLTLSNNSGVVRGIA